MRLVGIVVAVLAIGCVRTQTEQCGDKVCPEGTRCSTYLDLSLCVTPEQTADCEGHDEGDACGDGATSGFCRDGACLPVGCGNGRIDDPIFARDEECDDGNRISHDGCSSTCRDEQPIVDEIYAFGIFPVTEVSLVTDTSADQLVMFGGSEYGAAVTSRTWAFADDTWRLFRTRTAPSARRAHASAYDRRRQCMVMFGGSNTDSRFSDTWEFDGTAWIVRQPTVAPPAQENHAMAYDPVRGVTVMFGGAILDVVMELPGSTWEWDGTDWHERSDARPQPIARFHQAMAFDHARGVMVMIVEATDGVTTYELDGDGWREVAGAADSPPAGGRSPIAWDAVAQRIVVSDDRLLAEELWSWDGSAWTSTAVVTTIDDRLNAAMATGTDGRVVRVGGNTSETSSPPTPGLVSRWDGQRWIEIPQPATPKPSSRVDFAGAYDARRHRIVMFGGESVVTVGTGAVLGDTWEFGPGGWTRVATSGPTAQRGHAMAYDAKRGHSVLVGVDAVTWLWDGEGWTSVAAPGPQPRTNAAMAYDAKRGVTVLFGGDAGGAPSDQTWEWDGVAWMEKPSATRPAPRRGHAMAYDPIRETVLLFGGRERGTVFSDTWEWDGDQWTKLEPPAVPTGRFGHGLAWDPTRQRMLVLGGSADPALFADPATRDVWEWNGTTWTAVPIALSIGSARVLASPGFESGTVLIGNQTGQGTTTLRIAYGAETPYETCTSTDHDRDGLVGCADPDCWARCTPLCMPGTTCDAAAARCGDAVCSAIESCRVCPSDCGECPALCGDGTCGAGEDCVGDCTP